MEFNINDVVNLISNLGFPIFIAVWLLIRHERRQEEMKLVIMDLSNTIKQLCWKLGEKKE